MWGTPSKDAYGVTHVVAGEGEERVEISIDGTEVKVTKTGESTDEPVQVKTIFIEEILEEAHVILEEAEIQAIIMDVQAEVLGEQMEIINEQTFVISELNALSEPIFMADMGEREEPYTIAIVSTVKGDQSITSDTFKSSGHANTISDLKFFPNPTTDKINISFFLEEEGQTNISIFDINGREVYRKDLGNFQGSYNDQIDVSDLKKGTYVLNIMQNNLRLAEKIIVN